jgi:ligand-binding SRPBCC domain-containing protein
MSQIRTIRQLQKLAIPVEEAWGFFSRPENLVKITPASLDFKITSELNGEEIYTGQLITYKVRPLLGIGLIWVSEITHVERHKLFVDEQRKGPYKMWHHEHHFKPVNGSTEITDIVQYKLPFGILGNLGLPIVEKQLEGYLVIAGGKWKRCLADDVFIIN